MTTGLFLFLASGVAFCLWGFRGAVKNKIAEDTHNRAVELENRRIYNLPVNARRRCEMEVAVKQQEIAHLLEMIEAIKADEAREQAGNKTS